MFRTQVKIEHSLLALNWLNKYGKYPDGYDSSDETAATAIATALKTNAINATTTTQDVKEKIALSWLHKYGKCPAAYDSSDETASIAAASETTASETSAIKATATQNINENLELTQHFKGQPVAGGSIGDRPAPFREPWQHRKTAVSSPVCQQVPLFSMGDVGMEPHTRRFCTTPLPVSVPCEEGWHADTCSSPLVHDVLEDFPGLLYCGYPYLPGSGTPTSMRGEELRAMWD